MPTRSKTIDSTWKKAVIAAAFVLFVFAAWQASKWGLANSAALRAADADVATYLTTLAPSDPQTHYAAAVLLERSFDPADIEKALYELETATALSPGNYLLWLELGRARERSGDPEGAEKALRHALMLAPNYARVQWALGNALLRQGRTEEAFVEIRKAVVGDPTLATSAATTAWQFFDGDVPAIRRAMQGSGSFDTSLAVLLVREGRFDDAMALWDALPAAEKKTEYKDQGSSIAGLLLAAKKFRYAARVLGDLSMSSDRPEPGKVTNGGFESGVKTENAGVFEWQIAAGQQPQIVLSGGQKHGGNNSLYLIFSPNDINAFRPISQTIAVEPGAVYELEIFYRSDLKTMAAFRWDVVDGEGKQVAISEPITARADWSSLRIRFKAPETSDGISIRFVRGECGQVCPVSGNLWFDDISLQKAAR